MANLGDYGFTGVLCHYYCHCQFENGRGGWSDRTFPDLTSDSEAGTLGPKCTPMGQDLQERRWQGQGDRWQEHGAPGFCCWVWGRGIQLKGIMLFFLGGPVIWNALKQLTTPTNPKKKHVFEFGANFWLKHTQLRPRHLGEETNIFTNSIQFTGLDETGRY